MANLDEARIRLLPRISNQTHASDLKLGGALVILTNAGIGQEKAGPFDKGPAFVLPAYFG